MRTAEPLAHVDPAVVGRMLQALAACRESAGQDDMLALALLIIVQVMDDRPAGRPEYAHTLDVLTTVTASLTESARGRLLKAL